MITLNLDLGEYLENQLEFLSSVSKRPKEFFVKEALIRYSEDLEDLEDVIKYQNQNRKEKSKKFYTHEEVKQKLGL